MGQENSQSLHRVRALRRNGAGERAVEESLAIEAPLQVRINDAPFTITMRTPGDDDLLVRGLLLTEGILLPDGTEPKLVSKHHPETGVIVCIGVAVPEGAIQRSFDQSRTFLSTSSCGLCGSKEMPETRGLPPVDPLGSTASEIAARVGAMMAEMNERQRAFHHAGGTHAAGLFTETGECLAVFEDIGRHNAVDKIVGWKTLYDPENVGRILSVSGRVSYEIVLKAWRANIGAVAAVSAPSSLAVETAAGAGIVLLAFCREDRATVYTTPEREIR